MCYTSRFLHEAFWFSLTLLPYEAHINQHTYKDCTSAGTLIFYFWTHFFFFIISYLSSTLPWTLSGAGTKPSSEHESILGSRRHTDSRCPAAPRASATACRFGPICPIDYDMAKKKKQGGGALRGERRGGCEKDQDRVLRMEAFFLKSETIRKKRTLGKGAAAHARTLLFAFHNPPQKPSYQ